MSLIRSGRQPLAKRASWLWGSFRRHGYIVLVPEIGEDLPEKNPLIQNHDLPEFNNITIENCMAAVGRQTLDFEAGVREIEKKLIATGSSAEQQQMDVFTEVVEPLERLGAPLETTWGLSKTLYLGNSTLMPTKSYLAIHDRAKRARATKFNSQPIYGAIKKALALERQVSGDGGNIAEEKKRILQKFALEGKLNGLDLSSTTRSLLAINMTKLANEKAKFMQRIDIATAHFSDTVSDPLIVRDFPETLLRKMASDSMRPQEGPWKITLQPDVYVPVLELCPDRKIRWNIWQAMAGRGSSYQERELRTSENLEEIRFLRKDIAKILGYETFVAMSMETKMAGCLENVNKMMNTLLEYAKPAQEAELSSLLEFARERNFEGNRIELWDLPYWRRKQLKSQHGFDEEAFREYFPLNKVLGGLFTLCENLFDIVIKRRTDVSAWHRDVVYYDVFEMHHSAPVAGFYLDPYARSDEKLKSPQSKGWMVGIQNSSQITGTRPLAALIFNFQAASGDEASHLSFREVQLLFQKFGHALQHLLTKTTYSEVSGVSNIEWDAVDVCGQVLCHWLDDPAVLKSISSHREYQGPLPSDKLETLINVQCHMTGVDLCRELYLSALDIELHTSNEFWLEIVKRLWPQYRCFTLTKEDSHPCNFTKIFCEDWPAAYYSHVWSKVIAVDVYSAFHEVRGDERRVAEVGKRFKDTFLSLGGSRHPSQVFRQFRGRDPSPKAILKSLGLKTSKNCSNSL